MPLVQLFCRACTAWSLGTAVQIPETDKGPQDHNLLDRQRLLERRKAQALVKFWKQELLGTPEEEVTLYQAPQLAEEKKVSGKPEAPGV